MRNPRFSLQLLGGFEILRDGLRVSDRCGGKMRALLGYLAVESAQPHSRQALSTLLWPEQDEDHARQSLRQALTSLRTVLGDRRGPASLLRVDRDHVALNREGTHEFDIAALDPVRPLVPAAGILRERARCRECHQVAAARYRGPLLAGLSLPDAPEFESWLDLKRQWFNRRAAEIFAHLAACYEQSGDRERALTHARAQLAIDPWNEEAHRQVMRLLAAGGERNAAMAHYRAVRLRLAEELGVEPEEQTRVLCERVSAGRLERAGTPPERLLGTDPGEARLCPSSPPGHTGERRALTVLTCEWRVGAQEDPESLHERAAGALAAAARVIREHRGEVVECDGAGLTAYFGYPSPCEQPSLQAVRAALAAHHGLAAQGLRTRVHTDEVFVPARRRGSCDPDAAVVGTAPRAARALHLAAGEVDLAISANTYDLVREVIEGRALGGALVLPDGREPLALYEVLGLRKPGSPTPPVPQGQGWKPGEPVPLAVTERIDAMLDGLGAGRYVLQLASCLAARFTERELATALCRVQHFGLDPQTLATALERLGELGVLEASIEGELRAYRFREPLVRAAVCRSQSRAQRQWYATLLREPQPPPGSRAN